LGVTDIASSVSVSSVSCLRVSLCVGDAPLVCMHASTHLHNSAQDATMQMIHVRMGLCAEQFYHVRAGWVSALASRANTCAMFVNEIVVP